MFSIKKHGNNASNEAQAIIESSHDGVIVVDQESRVTLVNKQAKEILGLPDQVIGTKITEFIPKSDLLRILRTGKKEIGDICTIFNRELIINRLPILEDGKVVGVVSNFKQIDDIQKMEMKIRKNLHQSGLEAKHQLSDIVGNSNVMKECKDLAAKFAKTNATIMIFGRSGTGKELFAQGIHLSSMRKKGPFVAVNCAALPESLLESELFGYEEGTFTGAVKGGKMGLFELAHGGTIFLDEIGEMPIRIQSMLLRVLEEREIRRIGGERVIPVDVRIIVATNRELDQMIQENTFREDLYYRLNILSLELPTLQTRLYDIPELVYSFLDALKEKHSHPVKAFSNEVFSLFYQYNWPGNVRELRNVVERMVILADDETITLKDAKFLTIKIKKHTHEKKKEIEHERTVILSLLKEEEGNKTKVAERLGVDRTTLWRKMRKYNL
ncbi:sigma 54-interacting transcriptional regulator [Fictibacillus enclensis]|uniref:sigma-54 interaction domain-containing protein n=1 Tax=Fictibacillus enclensis TaxID=1017270 RepID=UPI0025A17983|nr:sigma 54-interacting transcriptional regulator [Fictibacillus enclensis]MDM5340221.1 sigma 54-interacting transcriptional regulator [Fictibacillus enclensis]